MKIAQLLRIAPTMEAVAIYSDSKDEIVFSGRAYLVPSRLAEQEAIWVEGSDRIRIVDELEDYSYTETGLYIAVE